MLSMSDPDRDYQRRMDMLDERRERELRLERIERHTPASRGHSPDIRADAPRITSAMQTLAWTMLNGSRSDARDAGRVLAELVLEVGDEQAT